MIRIRLLLCAAAALSLNGAVRSTHATEAPAALEVHLAYVGDEGHSALRGVSQGVSEGNQQGQFLGQKYLLKVLPDEQIVAIKDPAPSAIFAAVGVESLRLLSELNPGVPVFNLVEETEGSRALCLANLLHVIPDQGMRRDAIAQWQTKNPGDTVEARAWHPEFEKYAGRQLNDRFTKAFDQGMDDYAWAGWAATKMLTDSVARIRTADAGALLQYLKSDLEFDGQKGVTMNFRANGQLRQVLLLVKGEKIVGEAPVRGVTSAEDLDSLGRAHCPAPPQTAQQ
jgi:hypothetical protein